MTVRPALAPSRTDTARVTTLELFFDLVFVLAITQCTTLMEHGADWLGLARGVVALGLLWWGWASYAWLTSVIDPERTIVRLALFGAMAGFLVCALCIPHSFGTLAELFAGAYAIVRALQIGLFWLASRDEPGLRRSVSGLGFGTLVGLAFVTAGAIVGGDAQLPLWMAALVLEPLEASVFGVDGWKLVPGHFAERHGLIVIIALGESIVAIGLGAQTVTTETVVAAILGVVVAAALWWIYFDVLAHVAERRLRAAAVGAVQNGMARDGFTILHFPLVAGIDLLALGLRTTLADVDQPLPHYAGAALLGGAATYLIGHSAFGWRTTGRIAWDTLVFAALAVALLPVAFLSPALVTLGCLAALLTLMVCFKVWRYGEGRTRVRGRILNEGAGEHA